MRQEKGKPILEKILKRDKEPNIFSRGDKYGQGRPVGQAVADHPDRNFFRDPPLLRERPRKNFLIEAEVAGTREIKYWVLGWGAHAEVLEPAFLREEVLAEARSMARLYDTGMMVNETMDDYEFSRSAPRQPKTGS